MGHADLGDLPLLVELFLLPNCLLPTRARGSVPGRHHRGQLAPFIYDVSGRQGAFSSDDRIPEEFLREEVVECAAERDH